MDFINRRALPRYDSYPETFKNLVKKDHKLLYFMQLLHDEPNKIKEKGKHFLEQHRLLLRGYENRCQFCFRIFGNPQVKDVINRQRLARHHRMCQTSDWHRPEINLLTFDLKQYYCQIGCPFVASRVGMIVHLLRNHSHEELKLWAISPDRLKMNLNAKTTLKVGQDTMIDNFRIRRELFLSDEERVAMAS